MHSVLLLTCRCARVSVCVPITKWHLAKMAGPIEMPFGMWAQVDPSNHVLVGDLDPLRETGML